MSVKKGKQERLASAIKILKDVRDDLSADQIVLYPEELPPFDKLVALLYCIEFDDGQFRRLTKKEIQSALKDGTDIYYWSEEQQAYRLTDRHVVRRYASGLHDGPAKGYFAKVGSL